MKLYSMALSGHAHRAKLMISLLGLDADIVEVDLAAGAHKQADFMAKNPFGQVPVLEDNDLTIWDSNAILVYLASKYDQERSWLPADPAMAAEVHAWLSKAANEVANGIALARIITIFGAPLDLAQAQAKAHDLLQVMETKLGQQSWLAGDTPTIADVAVYTYTAHGPEGGVDLTPYPGVTAWLERVEGLPNFVSMQHTETDAKKALAA